MLQKQWILASSCLLCLCFDCQWAALWSLKTVKRTQGCNCRRALELWNGTPTTSSPLASIGVLREGVWHVALWMGEGARESKRGRERHGGRERHCSVVVYVSLRSCVGRSSPSHRCCCCEKRQNKGLPTQWNPYTCLAVLWTRPDGML